MSWGHRGIWGVGYSLLLLLPPLVLALLQTEMAIRQLKQTHFIFLFKSSHRCCPLFFFFIHQFFHVCKALMTNKAQILQIVHEVFGINLHHFDFRHSAPLMAPFRIALSPSHTLSNSIFIFLHTCQRSTEACISFLNRVFCLSVRQIRLDLRI